MKIEFNYRENEDLRRSFNELAEKVFGLNFENWYQNGFWKDNYIPYSVIEDGKVVSNVSVNACNMNYGGRIVKLIQLGTIMTDPDYRDRKEQLDVMEKKRSNTYMEVFEQTKVDPSVCEEFASELPLTKEFRPAWDVKELMKLGFSNIKIHCLDRVHYHPEGPHGPVETPMSFILSAVKTHSIYEWSIEFPTHGVDMIDLKKETENVFRFNKLI